MKSGHILIIDDRRDIREPLADYLRKNGYRISIAEDAGTARELLQEQAIDLVILGMITTEEGRSMLRYLRATSSLPVILLTAETTDRVIRQEFDVDDYVTIPFNSRVLLARIKNLLLRTRSPSQRRMPATGHIRFDDWILDIGQQQLLDRRNKVAVTLSPEEFLLLHALLTHAQRALSREQLLDLTHGPGSRLLSRSIDIQISRLRRKLEADPEKPRLIKNVHGGYMCSVAAHHVR